MSRTDRSEGPGQPGNNLGQGAGLVGRSFAANAPGGPAAPAVEADLRGTYMDPNTPAERFRRPRPTVDRPDDREPKPCPVCGETCKYDGWDHVHRSGLGIGSCRPAAPAAGADLWKQIGSLVFGYSQRTDLAELITDALLAGPLRSLVEQAAEVARLRETVARVEALDAKWRDGRLPDQGRAYDLRRALDGTDG